MSRHPHNYSEIDWNLLWKNARDCASRPGRSLEDWDRDAQSFADRNADSPFASMVTSRLPVDSSMTVLDIGCGPGTLTLPLSRQVAEVTAIDYSEQMLKVLSRQADEMNLTNIHTIRCAWENDWDECGVGSYDLVIASRSLGVVNNLGAALKKICAHSRGFAVICDRIAPTPFDPAAFAAVGRHFEPGPDYIYTLNILYGMGIHPSVDILELERDLVFPDIEAALDAYTWMFKDMDDAEKKRLRDYVASRVIESAPDRIVIRREYPPRWIMLCWQQPEKQTTSVGKGVWSPSFS